MKNAVLTIIQPYFSTSVERPLFLSKVPAGFPSPADDYLEGKLDLNEHLIKQKAATFFVRVTGDSMLGAGIHDGDLLIVDRSLEAQDKSVVVAVVNGEFTVKRIKKENGRVWLMPENKNYQPMEMLEGSELEVWGVVTNVIHKL
ncbi:MAG: LexA family protein [Alphaproteobacteria bacterium]